MKRRFNRTLVTGLFGLLLLPGAALPAHQSGTGIGTANWTVLYNGVSAGVSAAADHARSHDLDPTDVNTSRVNTLAAANVRLINGFYGATFYGQTYFAAGKWVVDMNLSQLTTTQQTTKSTTHEFGHVGQLGHTGDLTSAMASGASPPIIQHFNFHDLSTLNATY